MPGTLPAFDELKKLAESNPDGFETLRQQLVEELISSAPSAYQRRLRGLQFQVDMERLKAKNPMDSCIRISRMMHDSFEQMRSALNGVASLNASGLTEVLMEANREIPGDDQSTAKVLPFRRA